MEGRGTTQTGTSVMLTVIGEVRGDYKGQPRDKLGRFASSNTGSSGDGNRKVVKTFAKGAALGVALGGAYLAGQLVGGGPAGGVSRESGKEPKGNKANDMPEAKPVEPENDKASPANIQLKNVIEHLRSKDNPSSSAGTSVPAKTSQTHQEFQSSKDRKKPTRSYSDIFPEIKGDTFDVVLDEIRDDRKWDPSKHPRDEKGRFTSKGRRSVLGGAITPSKSGSKGSGKPNDSLDDLTIRELKEVARSENVVGYSNMDKDKLTKSIRLVRSDPEFRKAASKTLEKERKRKRLVNELARQTPQGRFIKQWEKINRMTKAAGVSPAIAGAAITAFLLSQSVTAFRRDKAEYMSHANESAVAASDRAADMKVDLTDKPNLVFAVGGYKGMGSTGKKIAKELTSDKHPDGQWFEENAQIMAVENEVYDVKPLMPKTLPGGVPNPAYLGEVMVKHAGQVLSQKIRKRNAASVDLAAQIYAHAIARDESGKLRVNGDKPIHIVTHGVAGGATVDEALLILKSMKLKQAEGGDSILKRVNVVKLGSTSMRMADPPTTKPGELTQKTYTSPSDPFNALPKDNEFWKSDIKGGEISDYLSADSIRSDLRVGMGGESGTYYYHEKVPSMQREAVKRQKSADDLENKTLEELRTIAKSENLKYKNRNQADLIKDIAEKRRKEAEAESEGSKSKGASSGPATAATTPQPEPKSGGNRRQAKSKPKEVTDDPSKPANKSPLMKKTKSQLEEMARSAGVSTSGTKAEIIERLRNGNQEEPKKDAFNWVMASLQEV